MPRKPRTHAITDPQSVTLDESPTDLSVNDVRQFASNMTSAPDLDSIIAATTTARGDKTERTTLDDLAERLDAAPEPDAPEPDAPELDGYGEAPVRRRPGRPRKDGTFARPRPREVSSFRELGRTSKGALVARVRELEAVNAVLTAQTDTGAVNRLSLSVEMLAHVSFGLVAEWRGPRWKLAAEEAKQLGTTTATAAAPHAAQLEAAMPWAAPCLVLVGIVAKRVIQERQELATLAATRGTPGENRTFEVDAAVLNNVE